MRGTPSETTLEWARRAEAQDFATVATRDRLVYANYLPLIALSAVAAVTRGIRLVTSVSIRPYRNAAELAKQAGQGPPYLADQLRPRLRHIHASCTARTWEFRGKTHLSTRRGAA